MYGEKISISEDNIEALFEAADYLLVSVLMKNICKFLATKITIQNCFKFLRYTERFTFNDFQDPKELG